MSRKPKISAADRAAVASPPLSAAQLKAMRPAAEVVPEIVRAARRRGERGPQKTPTKELVSVRLSADVLAYFRRSGPGWQTRINETLERVVTRQKRRRRA